MAYFPDLSPYTYGHDDQVEGWRQDLNVGWLASGHDYPRGATPPRFVEALLVCATRPARPYRGLHDCDFCGARAVMMDLDGRAVLVGNGEVRVLGPDRSWYAAPTLVAHYVDAHGYLPPREFIEGVFAHAPTIYTVRGAQLRRLRELGLEERLETCLAVLRAIAAHRHAAVEHLVPKILDATNGDPDRDQWRAGWKDCIPRELWEADELVTSACISIVIGFTREYRMSDERRDEHTLGSMIRLLEEAADAGMDVSGFAQRRDAQ